MKTLLVLSLSFLVLSFSAANQAKADDEPEFAQICECAGYWSFPAGIPQCNGVILCSNQ
jgi:hypothetical protein